jgi:uncharacterized protein YdcH (DUF465 family)
MTHRQNELAEIFPELAGLIRKLKQSDRHFARLVDEYHQTNGRIHRFETDVEPTSDEAMEAEKKARLKLLDEIGAILHATS